MWVFFGVCVCKIYLLFLAALGLPCYVKAFSSCSEWGYSIIVVCWLLIVVASLVREQWLSCPWACSLESSRSRNQIRVPCIGRQILNH